MPKRARKAAPTPEEPSSSESPEKGRVIYIGHLPHGFYENQLQGFFSQFGVVTNRKLSRNKKTAKSKHYAFVEFRSPEVAAIAAEAMDGYMMFTQKLDCRVMKPSEVHKDMFKGTQTRFKQIKWHIIEENRQNKERTTEEQEKRLARAIERDAVRQKAIAAAGLDYSYVPLSSLKASNSGKEISVSKQGEKRTASEVDRSKTKSKKPKSKAKKQKVQVVPESVVSD